MSVITDKINEEVRRICRARAARDEEIVRAMLGQWVSELEPAIAYDYAGHIIGLTAAEFPVGVRRDGRPLPRPRGRRVGRRREAQD